MHHPISPDQPLAQKRVILTGASSGIGRELARQLAAAGAALALVSRHPRAIAEELQAHFPTAVIGAYPCDLTDLNALPSRWQEMLTDFGGVDILINNAGTAYIGNLAEMPLSQWQHLFDLNLTSVFLACQAVIPSMRSQHQGTILNIASIAAKQSFPQWGGYCASKFALLAMAQALGAEERAYGIRVMNLCPGSVDTPLWDKLGDAVPASFDRAAMLQPQTVATTALHLLTMPATATIEELILMPNGGAF
ncbi:MAG: SDR family oxidoreductase [Oscillatoriales cyanobacterium SM2_2_1]|nr:SDR family oxidoreductase [Oscillatoriales cyanobacterium SM2_2_1]